MYYFEYPSFVAMMVREIKYGVELGLDAVSVVPFGAPESFQYHTGDIHVALDPAAVSTLSVPGSGLFAYALHSMVPSAEYSVAVKATITTAATAEKVACSTPFVSVQVRADAEGKLVFTAPRGTDCALVVTKL
jgi:hypothetical protein